VLAYEFSALQEEDFQSKRTNVGRGGKDGEANGMVMVVLSRVTAVFASTRPWIDE